jgi:hypothetical protein
MIRRIMNGDEDDAEEVEERRRMQQLQIPFGIANAI